MYCIQCGYDLRMLTSGKCPECGRPFDPNDPKTFRMGQEAAWWWRNHLLRWITCYLGFGSLIVGPYFLVIGMASFFWRIDGMRLNGQPVTTVPQKMVWMAGSITFTLLGLGFIIYLWPRRKGKPLE